MLAHTLVHFTCVLRRQPCKEITSALVVLLCYNTGPAAGELQLLVCFPSDQTSTVQHISSLPTRLKSFWCPTPQLPCCLWLLGEMQTLHLQWRDAGFWFKKGFFLLSAVPALPYHASTRVPLLHTAASVGKSLAALRSLIAGLPRGSVSASRSPVIFLSFFNQIVPKGSVGRNTG